MARESAPLPTILLIEDNYDDFEATQRSFKKANLVNPLHWSQTGQDGLDYLTHQGRYAETRPIRPGLILLDLNMPGLDGRAALGLIKGHVRLRVIPVIILTTSSDSRDVEHCYELGASTYIQKPVGFDSLVGAAARMRDYWFGMALLPGMTGT
jgi:two-component system, response regulator